MHPDTISHADPHQKEIVRLILQSLTDMGYRLGRTDTSDAASHLERESGLELEPKLIQQFRECILDGKWDAIGPMISQLKMKPGSDEVGAF